MRAHLVLGLWMVVALLPLSAQGATDSDVVEPVARGTMNWTTGVITATVRQLVEPPRAESPALRKMMAERGAARRLQDELLNVLEALRVDSATVVADLIADDDQVRAIVGGLIKSAEPVQVVALPDEVELTYRVETRPALNRAVREWRLKKPGGTGGQAAAPSRGGASGPRPKAKATGRRYTGLVIDTRGLGVQPALLPHLVTATGQVLEPHDGDQQALAGGAIYSRMGQDVRWPVQAGPQPWVIKAATVHGTDIVLQEADAQLLAQSGRAAAWGQQGFVILCD